MCVIVRVGKEKETRRETEEDSKRSRNEMTDFSVRLFRHQDDG